MKKHILFTMAILLGLATINVTQSQTPKITLMHNGVSTFFSSVTNAYNAATNNDTIYLPGGNLGVLSLTKKLTFIGAGYHPDSTAATFQTEFSLHLYSGASGARMIGVKGFITFKTTTTPIISSFLAHRCYIDYINSDCCGGTLSNAQNILFSECIISSVNNAYLNLGSIAFDKCIFLSGAMFSGSSGSFSNNIIYDDGLLEGHTNSMFTNNIFITTATTLNLQNVSYSTFSNNLFCSTAGSLAITNWGYNNNFTINHTSELAVNTFVNAVTSNYSDDNDYHLKPTSPGKNYGLDGTDVGIYGTLQPWKDGGLPFNPHISSKTIGTQLSPTGNLSIDIRVTAQDH